MEQWLKFSRKPKGLLRQNGLALRRTFCLFTSSEPWDIDRNTSSKASTVSIRMRVVAVVIASTSAFVGWIEVCAGRF